MTLESNLKTVTPALTKKLLREFLDYDPTTGILTWKKRHRKWFKDEVTYKKWNTRRAGKQAFAHQAGGEWLGYLQGSLFGTMYLAHRIIFFWMKGRWPSPTIDHINQVKSDNRWSNLREATKSLNGLNRGPQQNNLLGIRGVVKSKRKRGGYIAQFRSQYLGTFETIEEAVKAHSTALKKAIKHEQTEQTRVG